MDRLYDVPRRLCLESALQIAKILHHHQQQYPGKTIFATGVQHADAAATVLQKALQSPRSSEDANKCREAYHLLIDFIRLNAVTYDAAIKMLEKLGVPPEATDTRDDSSESTLMLPPPDPKHGNDQALFYASIESGPPLLSQTRSGTLSPSGTLESSLMPPPPQTQSRGGQTVSYTSNGLEPSLLSQTRNGTVSPNGTLNSTPNFPNFGNVMYAHEIAFLRVD